MRIGFATSAVSHAMILTWGLVSFSPDPFDVAPVAAVPVDILSVEEFAKITKGLEKAPNKALKDPAVFKQPDTTKKPLPADKRGNAQKDRPNKDAAPKQEVGETKSTVSAPKPRPPARKQPVAKPKTQPKPAAKPVEKAAAAPAAPRPLPNIAPRPKPKPKLAQDQLAALVKKSTPKPEDKTVRNVLDDLRKNQPDKPQVVKPVKTETVTPQETKTPEPKTEAKKPEDKPQDAVYAGRLPPRKPKVPASFRKSAKKSSQKPKKTLLETVRNVVNKQDGGGGTAGSDNRVASLGKRTGKDAKLSASELDALRDQLQNCWSPPPGASGDDTLRVQVAFRLKRNGELDGLPRILNSSASQYFDATANSVSRAVRACAPFSLPPEKFDVWQDIRVTFYPQNRVVR